MSEPSWLVAIGIAAAVALQVLQTIQIAIVGRKVARTLAPPPLRVPPAAGACSQCGTLTPIAALKLGLCPQCDPPTLPNRPRSA